MERIRIVIIEDEFVIAEDLRERLEESGYSVIHVFDRAEPALGYILHELPDLLLVDIRLSTAMTGIDLVDRIKATHNIPVVYITANSDEDTFAKARNTRPQAFLVKPFTTANLLAAIDLALFHFSEQSENNAQDYSHHASAPSSAFSLNRCLFVRTQNRYKKICADDILFIEADGSYVRICTKQEHYTLAQNLTSFHRKNPLPGLLRIHRSYIVNLMRVDGFDDATVSLGDHKLPMSDAYRAEFMTRIHCL